MCDLTWRERFQFDFLMVFLPQIGSDVAEKEVSSVIAKLMHVQRRLIGFQFWLRLNIDRLFHNLNVTANALTQILAAIKIWILIISSSEIFYVDLK